MTMSSWLTSPLLRTGISSSPMSSSMLYTAEGMNTVDSVCEKNPISTYYNITVTMSVNGIWVENLYVKYTPMRKSLVDNRFSGKLNTINEIWRDWNWIFRSFRTSNHMWHYLHPKPLIQKLAACALRQMTVFITALLIVLPLYFIKTHHLLFIYLQQISKARVSLHSTTQRDIAGLLTQ